MTNSPEINVLSWPLMSHTDTQGTLWCQGKVRTDDVACYASQSENVPIGVELRVEWRVIHDIHLEDKTEP